MAKLALAKLVGIPVPAVIADDVTHLVCYYGPPGFTPNYSQVDRIAIPLNEVVTRDVNGVEHYVFDTSILPPTDTSYDMYFTLADANDDEEGDFSPVVSVPLDRVPPIQLDQPVVL